MVLITQHQHCLYSLLHVDHNKLKLNDEVIEKCQFITCELFCLYILAVHVKKITFTWGDFKFDLTKNQNIQ